MTEEEKLKNADAALQRIAQIGREVNARIEMLRRHRDRIRYIEVRYDILADAYVWGWTYHDTNAVFHTEVPSSHDMLAHASAISAAIVLQQP